LPDKYVKDYLNKLRHPNIIDLLPPYKILSDFGLKSNIDAADVGAKTGYFSLPMAELIGTRNFLYSIDRDLDMIEIIDKKISQNSIKNIRTVVSSNNDLKIDTNSVEFVFAAFILSEVNYDSNYIKELKRILKDGGVLAILDWKRKEKKDGHVLNTDINQIKTILSNFEIKFSNLFDVNDDVFGIKLNT
jgi:ubiquinone/menaquinone biosynthesis C-methylase UbiE